MKFERSNIPVPEAYLAVLLVGAGVQRLMPWRFVRQLQPARKAGAFMLISGILIAAWSVAAAGREQLSEPQVLVAGGPYRYSRNPMYLAWLFISYGLALLFNSAWMAASLPFAFLYIHLVEIPREEAGLAEKFGEEYQRYRRRVRRYL